jgi:hypothetical protein
MLLWWFNAIQNNHSMPPESDMMKMKKKQIFGNLGFLHKQQKWYINYINAEYIGYIFYNIFFQNIPKASSPYTVLGNNRCNKNLMRGQGSQPHR